MATAAFNLTYDNTSDATYRTWVNALHTQITAMGWVQTADTGQFSLGAGVRASVVGTNYLVYRTNDGGTNLYLRLDLNLTAVVTTPGLAVTTGLATDGAGAITGTQATGRWTTGAAAGDTTPRTCIISGSTSRLALAINMNAATLGNSIGLVIERAKDGSGADVTTGAYMVAMLSGSNTLQTTGITNRQCLCQYIPASGGTPPIEIGLLALLGNGSGGSSAYGATTPLGVWVPIAGAAQNPGYGILCVSVNDYPARDTTQTVAMYSVNHVYYAIGPNWTSCVSSGGTVVSSRLLLRYE